MALLGLTALNYFTSPSEDATFAMLLPVVGCASLLSDAKLELDCIAYRP